MPFNDKKEWVNPPVSDFPKSDIVLGCTESKLEKPLITEKDLYQGYSVCHCGAYKLLQAGFEAEMFLCNRCNEYAAAPFEIFDSGKQKLDAEHLSK